MDPQDTPESNIPATNINPNKNQTDQVRNSTKKIQPSHLKKNEFALILIGALLLTVVIFFLFFRSSDIRTETVKTNTSSSYFADLEQRVEALEKDLEIWKTAGLSPDGSGTGAAMGIGPVKERVASLETAFSVKFDSLLKRLDNIEKSISGSKKKSIAVTTSQPVAKPAEPEKKEIKAGLFHTIKKGETLYSISKKYNTTVTNIQKLNKLSPDAKIYQGDSILVR
ncbi:MAG: LysM peptidoglycan-binding domain-containing protein [Deltaproteobacteria bacterium]|uniref:LysM peptidoglycan-binding domain-containing protein n=1 Tax=Desulfobacula sp. TaxID=2593537 RepID=UPI0019BED2EC|nr:LysM peptidoglycan-binding domain-containing protein [Candidatus Desulfobacula maris]MBL6995324.1 LysM peptidoglycan-binding domain-containing protein [Desulfobacula sp.]